MTPLLAQRPRPDRAFERLYRRHVGDVYRYALAVLRSPQDAEDVTQTTFLNAYRAYERGERPRRPQNWLIAIAHNVCRQRFRQVARRPSECALDESDAVAESFADEEGPSAEDIRRALGYLSFNQRAALVMREIEGRSYAEIAEILDLSVSAVETLIFRARRALREQLEGGLTCHEAEVAVSRQLDGRLPRAERGALRAHLRECAECAAFARSQRAQRTALRGAFGLVPLPSSLISLFGGAAAGSGVAAKAAAVVAAGTVVVGAGYEGAQRAPWRDDAKRPVAAAAAAQQASAARDARVRAAAVVVDPGARGALAPTAMGVPRVESKVERSRAQPARASGRTPGAAAVRRRPEAPPGQVKKAATEKKLKPVPPGHAKRAAVAAPKRVPRGPSRRKAEKAPAEKAARAARARPASPAERAADKAADARGKAAPPAAQPAPPGGPPVPPADPPAPAPKNK